MFQKAREKTYLESTSLLFLLVRWRKPLIIILLFSVICSLIFSGTTFIKPKFRSSVIFFPSSTNSISKALLEESNSDKQDILAYGEEEKAEQMLQILNSDEIRDLIVKKYNLLDHYEISSNANFPMSKLYEKFKDNISFTRTEYMSVRIDVLDTDPKMAAAIANDIASLLDSVNGKIQRSRAEDAFKILQKSYELKLLSVKQKEDSLQRIRLLGVMNFEGQADLLNKELIYATSTFANERASLSILEKYKSETDTAVMATKGRILGAEARMKTTKAQLENLSRYGGASVSLNEQLKIEREELSKLKKQYDKLFIDANQNLTPKFIVNKAVVSEKKCYPVRWFIVFMSFLLTLILSVVIISLFERMKEIKYNL